MRILVSRVTKLMARAFHSFVQSRLRAEMFDAELILRRDPPEEVVQEESPAIAAISKMKFCPKVGIFSCQWSEFFRSRIVGNDRVLPGSCPHRQTPAVGKDGDYRQARRPQRLHVCWIRVSADGNTITTRT